MPPLIGFLLGLSLQFLASDAYFRGLESTGVLDQLDYALQHDHYQPFEKLTMGQNLEVLNSLRHLTPERVKRAALENDVRFGTGLAAKMKQLFHRDITRPCFADLIYFVESFSKLLFHAERLQRCGTEANVQTCKCLNSTSQHMEKFTWTLRFLDAMGKVPSGVLHGNYWFLGDFQQCRNINTKTVDTGEPYRGKFCMTYIGMGSAPEGKCPKNLHWDNAVCGKLSLNVGVCVPETCTEEDIPKIANAILRELQVLQPSTSDASAVAADGSDPQAATSNETQPCMCMSAKCHIRDLPYDAKAIIMLFVLGIIVALMIVGTAYEYWVFQPNLEKTRVPIESPRQTAPDAPHSAIEELQYRPMTHAEFFDGQATLVKFAMAFSIITNGRKLFDTKRRPGQVHCLHGLRFLSLCWVILGHTYYWLVPTLDNLIGVKPLAKDPINQIILNATFCVDCFFLISGFLLAYLWLKDTAQTKGSRIRSPKFWIMFYVHRYIRLTPVYALILGVDICLYRYITDGPFWNQDGLEPNYCRRSWWVNLIYLNNFLVQDELCMSWTWYLANDFQFYAFAPIILVLLWKYEVLGVLVGIVGVIASGVIKGVLVIHNDLPPSSLASVQPEAVEIQNRYWNIVYVKPYCRCGVYIIGLLLGYALFKLKKVKVTIPLPLVALGWVVCTVAHIAVLFGLWSYSNTGELPSKAAVFIYAFAARPVWALGLCWLIFCCVHGYAGPINSILSWGFWIPLSRLTYCAYLLHAFIAHGTYSSRFQSAHFDTHLRMVYYFLGHVLISYTIALFFYLAFESPILTLEKLIFGTGAGSSSVKKPSGAKPPQSPQYPPKETKELDPNIPGSSGTTNQNTPSSNSEIEHDPKP